MAYDHSEWAALYTALIWGLFSSFGFTIVAFAFHWKQWYKRPDVPKPWLLQPELYTIARWCSCMLAAFSIWLVNREIIRHAGGLNPPETTTAPSDALSAACQIIYIVFAGLCSLSGFAFFNVGLQMSWMSVPVIVEVLIAGCAITLTILFWQVWYVPGLLVLFSSVFFVYSLCIVIYFMVKTWSLKHSYVYWDPIDCLIQANESTKNKVRSVLERMEQSESPSVRVSMDESSSEGLFSNQNQMRPVYPYDKGISINPHAREFAVKLF